MTVYLIGEAPPPGAKLPHPAFTGKSGQRLSEWVGFKVSEVFECDNLLPFIPEPSPSGRGMSFPIIEAKRYARELLLDLIPEEDRIIVVGVRCLKAFRPRKNLKPMVWYNISTSTYLTLGVRFEGILFSYIPHPSASSKWYNNNEHRRQVKDFLTDVRKLQEV